MATTKKKIEVKKPDPVKESKVGNQEAVNSPTSVIEKKIPTDKMVVQKRHFFFRRKPNDVGSRS